jgi:hypothetical protein
MKKLLFALGLVSVLALPASAVSQTIGPRQYVVKNGVQISAAPMDGSGASMAFTLDTEKDGGGLGILNIFVEVVDANNSVTQVVMTCTSNPGDGLNYKNQSLNCASTGACTSYPITFVANSTAGQPLADASPKLWHWRMDIEGENKTTCTFTNTGGAAADLLTVTARSATKGS